MNPVDGKLDALDKSSVSNDRVRSIPASRFSIGSSVAFLVAIIVVLSAQRASAQDKGPETSTPEVFEAVDPYTKGKPELLERAGYASMGPFLFSEGIKTQDVEESLGGVRVLWVETAHFKLGSMLRTYRRCTDDLEEKQLAEELHRLSKKLSRVRPQARELDPWLRLHLYAQRLEDEYADFEARAGVTDADFTGKPTGDTNPDHDMGPGRFLGCAMKFTVLLTENGTQLDRFARRWLKSPETAWYIADLQGGSWFFGAAAEVMQKAGAPLDSALHALVATGVAECFMYGYRDTSTTRPIWFLHGIALAFGRKAEPRWSVYLPRDSEGPEDQTWLWEERVNGLVTNKFVPTWDEMFAWKDPNALEPRGHMTAWSRVAWLMETDATGFQKYLHAVTNPIESDPKQAAGPEDEPERQRKISAAVLGKTPAELDEAWRKWVRRKYPKK
jgi:hypothetical protein